MATLTSTLSLISSPSVSHTTVYVLRCVIVTLLLPFMLPGAFDGASVKETPGPLNSHELTSRPLQRSITCSPSATPSSSEVREISGDVTCTLTRSVLAPPGPEQDTWYVALLFGETVAEPLVLPPVLNPEPEQLVALLELQESVLLCPCVMLEGLAERDALGAGVGAETFTRVLFESLPPAPIQVT